MKKCRIVLLFVSLLISVSATSQPTADFTSVDSLAKSIRYKGNLDTLTRQLTSHYASPLLKARSIFKWITENIEYDCKSYNRHYHKGKPYKTFRCRTDEECASKEIAWEIRYIDRILRKKKAICDGYSKLFKKMCDIAGLRSVAISGYTRKEYYQVGSYGSLDHAWNAVWIDSAWYLLDATWAAGGCDSDEDGKLLEFFQNFNEYYWLTPAEDFARNHYPEDSMWTLIPHYTKEKFSANPYYLPGELKRIKLIMPKSGIINAKKGDTIRFKIDYRTTIKKLQINSNIFRNPDIYVEEKISRRKTIRKLDTFAVNRQRYVKYKHFNDLYEFEYIVTDNSLYFLDIMFDRIRVMRFNVKIQRPEE